MIGANPTVNHPVAATWMKNAAKRGTRFVLADPRRTELARHAWRVLQFKADADVALLNAMIHTVIEEGLADEAFIAERTTDFDALREHVADFQPGGDGGGVRHRGRDAARGGARLRHRAAAMILWGMGISQHVHGTDNARA